MRAALGINEVVTQVKNQVAADDHVARTLTNAVTYKSPDWDEVLQPQLVKRDEQVREQLEQAKQAEEARQKAAQAAVSVAKPAAPAYGGSHQDWMAAAGIPQALWGYVDYIVSRESGWNPNAVNRSSGACGLGQQLPCGKWAGAWNDPIAALQAMNGYVGRYGGWAGAVAFWQAHNWY